MLIQFHNWTKSTSNYIYFDLHGRTTSGTTAHLIVYGVNIYDSNIDPKIYDNIYVIENGNLKMQSNRDLNIHKIINLANPTDEGDACNKRSVDIVDTEINNLSPYTKDHVNRNIFGTYFYDLLEISQFNLIQGVTGVVINKINPNFILKTDRFITDYDQKYGLRLIEKTHIQTTNILNQNSNYTIFMSFLHDKNEICEISYLILPKETAGGEISE